MVSAALPRRSFYLKSENKVRGLLLLSVINMLVWGKIYNKNFNLNLMGL